MVGEKSFYFGIEQLNLDVTNEARRVSLKNHSYCLFYFSLNIITVIIYESE